MAEIKELGESLLQNQRDRSDRKYKESKREAYKIALATAGVGLVNEHLKNKATQFMTSEPVLAQKAKYRAAVTQADRIVKMNDEIMASGKSAEQWFMDSRYMPAMEEQYKAQFGTQFVPTSYLPSLREKALELAKQEATTFSEALGVAQTVPDYETAMSQIDSVVVPPTNAGSALLRKVRGLFTGRTEGDFQNEALSRVEQQGLIKNASVQDAFNKVRSRAGLDEAVDFVKRLDTQHFESSDKVTVETRLVPEPKGNGVIVVHIESVTDAEGNNKSQEVRHERIEGLETPEEVRALEKAIMDQADLPKVATDTLSPAANALLAQRLSDRGVTLYDLRTPDNFQFAARTIQDLRKDPENLRDDAAAENRATVLSAGLEAASGALAALSNDIQKGLLANGSANVGADTLTAVMNALSTAVGGVEGVGSVPAVPSTTTIYPDGPISWDTLDDKGL